MFGINDSQSNQGAGVSPQLPIGGASGPIPNPPSASAIQPGAVEAPAPQAPSTEQFEDDYLLKIKQQALQSLSPLVHQLDQRPEEKFKTTMMLIQASDDAKLIKQAYEAANQIADEKVRAQALIDVINEINYFTHKDDAS
jgi:hypothetical protein